MWIYVCVLAAFLLLICASLYACLMFIQSLRAFRRAAPSALNSDGDCFCTSCMGHLHPYTSWMITLHLIEVLENPVSVPAV